MKIRLKKFLNKHKNTIFSFIAVIACIPLLNFNAYAINDTYPVYSLSLNNVYSSYGVDFVRGDDGVYWVDFPSSSSSSEIYIRLFDDESESDSYLNFPIIEDSYDYYVYTSYAQRTTGGSFIPSSIVFCTGDGRTEYPDQILEQNRYINRFIASNADYGIIQTVFLGKLDIHDASDKYNKYGAIKFKGDNGTFLGRQYFEFAIIMVPKGNAQTFTDIMNTINYQTHVLGEKIDSTNNMLQNGNSNSAWYAYLNYGALSNLDQVKSQYRATEQQFFNDFNSNQQAITSDIVGWSWGGLVNCANWVGETMTDYYNNMGDFRQYIIYPLMLGIALFFLGRGGSIIGHLFRKPTTTTVNTKSVFRREGNTKYTTTTTSRQGGVFRR